MGTDSRPGWEWAHNLELEHYALEQGIYMNINQVYRSGTHLKAEDLPRDVTVTIDAWDVIEFEDNERKLVIRFTGKDKDLVLNKTNASTISEMYGPDTDAWLGKTITIGPDRANFGGKMVPCIRVRLTNPAEPQHQPAPPPPQPQSSSHLDDDIPF